MIISLFTSILYLLTGRHRSIEDKSKTFKIVYVFTGGRKKRLNFVEGEYPREFLLGYPFLQSNGLKVDLIELDDLENAPNSKAYKWHLFKNYLLNKVTGLNSSSRFLYNSGHVLNKYDIIVACNEYVGFGLAHLKKKKLIRGKIFCFVMGMMDHIANINGKDKIKHYIAYQQYKKMIKYVHGLLFVGYGEFQYARKSFGCFKNKFQFLPFAVDTDFWGFKDYVDIKSTEYILFVGNDKYRDYNGVKKIIKNMPDKIFVVISKNPGLKELESSPHVRLIGGDWKESVLSDSEMRNYFRNASLVILPLLETLQPSGQSVALQAMACGKTVMITKTNGFWEPAVFEDNKHLIFMKSNTPDAWIQKINFLQNDSEILNRIGNEALSLVNTNNHLNRFGSKMMDVINGID